MMGEEGWRRSGREGVLKKVCWRRSVEGRVLEEEGWRSVGGGGMEECWRRRDG